MPREICTMYANNFISFTNNHLLTNIPRFDKCQRLGVHRQGLEEWMDSRGHSLSSYRHAKCFLIDGIFCDTPILPKRLSKSAHCLPQQVFYIMFFYALSFSSIL